MWICPKCYEGSACFCNSCKERNPEIIDRAIVDAYGEGLICPHCNNVSHFDDWMDEEYKRFNKLRKEECLLSLKYGYWLGHPVVVKALSQEIKSRKINLLRMYLSL